MRCSDLSETRISLLRERVKRKREILFKGSGDEQLQALVRVSAATGQPIKIVTLDGMSYDCYLTGGKEPTVWERKHDKIVVQDMPDYVVNRLMNFEAQEQSDIFNKEHFQNDITTLITFMNNLKLSYD